jgi:hypothetical protein
MIMDAFLSGFKTGPTHPVSRGEWVLGQGLKAGDDVEQFLVDATLAQLVKAPRSSNNSSMFFSSRCMAAKRPAFSLARDSADSRKKRDEYMVFVDLHMETTENHAKIWESLELIQRFDEKRRFSYPLHSGTPRNVFPWAKRHGFVMSQVLSV